MMDADLNINALNPFYNNTMSNETIWIRIENVDNPDECYEIGSFTINLIQQPIITTIDDLELCDDSSSNGIETFDLSLRNNQILGTQPATFNITYHSTIDDANQNINSISNIITSGNNTVWVRLENNQQIDCYDIAPLQLTVFPFPIVELPQDILKCANDITTITAPAGFEQYLWSTGETTRSIEVTEEGDYIVTVTDSNGCIATDSITVSNFEISVTGSGPWEYSIDNFFYQSSPVFTDLIPGYYTVYVRSTNGCDLVSAPATIIAAPNFFTPNQDGFHDFWQVIAIETEPDANIYIFDRFGKLLKQISPLGPGWDGTYIGNPMPSTDYWFRVELNDGQMFRGHFSLKR